MNLALQSLCECDGYIFSRLRLMRERTREIAFHWIVRRQKFPHFSISGKDKTMTRITISLAASALIVTLAPSVQAYGEEPLIDDTVDRVSLVNALYGQQSVVPNGVCQKTISPILTNLLALTPDAKTPTNVSLACVAE